MFPEYRCCDEDYGGSHYHCGRCNKVCSVNGHWVWIKHPKHDYHAKLVLCVDVPKLEAICQEVITIIEH